MRIRPSSNPSSRAMLLLRMAAAAWLACVGSGCMGIKMTSVYSRDEFVQLVKAHPSNWGNMYYYGTNGAYHHFATRVGGNSGYFYVSVAELTLAFPRPVSSRLTEIHPEDGFRAGPGSLEWSAPEKRS